MNENAAESASPSDPEHPGPAGGAVRRPEGADDPPSVSRLLRDRLAGSDIPDETRELLREALRDSGDQAAAPAVRGRVYLESVAVTGFRGIGPRARLDLAPKPGVTLVVGRNGSGKSSFADGVEMAFTGTSTRWEGRPPVWRSNWRNLHAGGAPKIELGLGVAGDSRPSTLVATWPGDDVTKPRIEFRRPGHGTGELTDAGWEQSLTDYRPFLSYSDLERVISGKPSQMYDSVATILGLGVLTAADTRLQGMEKELNEAAKRVEADRPGIVSALAELEDPRATAALAALAHAGSPDLDALAALVEGLPGVDDGHLRELRAVAGLTGPDLEEVGRAVDRLREAMAALEDVRASGAEDAHQRAELLAGALEHSGRHPRDESCPVCRTEGALGHLWAEWAAEQVEELRLEAAAAQDARRELRDAVDAVRYLVTRPPAWLPQPLADPWAAWTACRAVTDPEQLATRAERAARVLSDAVGLVRDEAVRELEKLDEGWRRAAVRLAGWTSAAHAVEADKPRLRQVRAARKWLKKACEELREERLRPFADHSQRIWEELRQQGNVDLRSVRLTGSDRAAVRKLVMDVQVDGEDASALGVLSQGELHSLALALFLPRAAAADSPFGFVVIDDPVQSMDPAKVHGLATVLHRLGETRQVVVFTHDTRLQRAFTDQELPVTMLEVERGERSEVRVHQTVDPVGQALADARALASTEDMPPAAMTHVLPGICRTVLERAFAEAAWVRLHRAGRPEHESEEAVAGATGLLDIAALGLFGRAARGGEIYRELGRRCGRGAVDVLKRCQRGAHSTGVPMPNPHRFVNEIAAIAEEVRRPEVAGQ